VFGANKSRCLIGMVETGMDVSCAGHRVGRNTIHTPVNQQSVSLSADGFGSIWICDGFDKVDSSERPVLFGTTAKPKSAGNVSKELEDDRYGECLPCTIGHLFPCIAGISQSPRIALMSSQQMLHALSGDLSDVLGRVIETSRL